MSPELIYSIVFLMSAFASLIICLIVMWNSKSRKHIAKLNRIEREKQDMLLKASVTGQENERKRIANDLHDGVGPLLSALKLQINSNDAHLDVEGINKTLNETVKNIRDASSRMSPAVLEQLGLNKAVVSIVNRFKGLSQATIELDWDNELEDYFDEEDKIHVYRIIQESLNNVIKHSSAKKIRMKGNRKDGKVVIRIKDNGNGFDISQVDGLAGIGLNTIKARSEILGAELLINSDSKGTKIKVIFDE